MSTTILHIITGLLTGGAERALYRLVTDNNLSGYQHSVLSLTDDGPVAEDLRRAGLPVYSLGIKSPWTAPSQLLQLKETVRKVSPDIIHGWMYHGNLASVFARRYAGHESRLLWNIRHSFYGLSKEKKSTAASIYLNRCFSKRPDAIVYNSQLSRTQHEDFGFCTDRTFRIPNGFDTNFWCPDKKISEKKRQELKIPPSSLVVGHVARYHTMKNHKLFVTTAVQLLKTMPNTYFLMCGRGVNADTIHLNDIVPESLRENFVLLGERNDVHEVMLSMDIFCLSSSWGEAFPNVLGEAMAAEVPCIATDVGDAALIVADTGAIVVPDNQSALLQSLLTMLQMSAQERQYLGKKARKRICGEFSHRSMIEKYTELYDGLSNDK